MEVKVYLLALAIPRFIQMGLPLPLLKTMAQSKRGVTQILEVQTHPPLLKSPHAVIEPSALRAAKAELVE
jgi:hypothetical protein